MNWILKWGFLIIKLIWTILSLIFLIFTFFLLFLFFRFKQNKKGRKKDKISKKWYKEFYNFCKCYIDKKKSILLYIILAVMMLGLPVAIQNNYVGIGMSLKKYINIGAPSAWLGFWGSYLGSILSISFAYINSKIEAKRQKESIERQLEQSKINDLDNAIKTNEINLLTMIVGVITDCISIIDIHTGQIELLIKSDEIMDLNTFLDFEIDFADTNLEYQKKWNKFILSYYNSKNVYSDLTNRNAKIKKLYEETSICILDYDKKIKKSTNLDKTLINDKRERMSKKYNEELNEYKPDKKILSTKLKKIFSNITNLRTEYNGLRISVLDLLELNKKNVKNKQDSLESEI